MSMLAAGLLLPLSVFAAGAGLLCALRPRKIIRIQQAFYARINWRIEPISMDKEIANTRTMGIFLVVCGAAALFFLFL